MRAALLGKNEEEALAGIRDTFQNAPDFVIEDIHEATKEELLLMQEDDTSPDRVIN